ncbi:hypothetical protein [Streptomyces cyaneofuscatus]
MPILYSAQYTIRPFDWCGLGSSQEYGISPLANTSCQLRYGRRAFQLNH